MPKKQSLHSNPSRRGERLRSAPWVRQSRKEQLAIRRKKERLYPPINPLYAEILRFQSRGESVPYEERTTFVDKYSNFILSVFLGGKKVRGKALNIGKVKEDVKDDQKWKVVLSLFRNQLANREWQRALNRFWELAHEYLNERGIPWTDGVYKAVMERMSRLIFENPFAAIDWPDFERVYIAEYKRSRRYALDERTWTNHMFEMVTEGKRLTPNQSEAARRLIRSKGMEAYRKAHREAIQRYGFPLLEEGQKYYEELAIKYRDETVDGIRKQLESQFVQKKKEKKTAGKPPTPKKIGSREERIASYVRAQKERTFEVREREKLSRISGKPFDSTAYCLDGIRKESAKTASLLEELFRKRFLSASVIQSFFVQGSLSQRVFVHTINETDFVVRFGEKAIEQLARGIVSIGPKSRRIELARKKFDEPGKIPIFEFLERYGVIETQHGGGKFVYLHRFHANS